jgi:hypothetical protein
MNTIKTHLYKSIHRSKKSAAQIADEIGISYSYLCRAGLPTDENGVRFPVELMVPLMKSCGNYDLLKHIAGLAGYLTVKIPHAFNDKKDEVSALNEYNELCTEAAKNMMKFFKKPSDTQMQLTIDSLQRVMEISAGLQKRIKNFNQYDLELE